MIKLTLFKLLEKKLRINQYAISHIILTIFVISYLIQFSFNFIQFTLNPNWYNVFDSKYYWSNTISLINGQGIAYPYYPQGVSILMGIFAYIGFGMIEIVLFVQPLLHSITAIFFFSNWFKSRKRLCWNTNEFGRIIFPTTY